MTPLRVFLLALLIAVALQVALGAVLLRRGMSARADLTRLEDRVLYRIRKQAVEAAARDQPNPFAGDPQAWRQGATHFGEHCAICHGADGRGAGPLGDQLYPSPPNMALQPTQQLSDGELYHIIANGIRFTGMPAWGGEDSPEEIWRLVSFIRELPELDPSELQELQPAPPAGHGGHEHPSGGPASPR